MALRESRMMPLGATAPEFALADVRDGRLVRSGDSPGSPLLVAFICNHCPFVKHVLDSFVAFANEYQAKGLAVVAISSNDVAAYPQDGPQAMAELAREAGFKFPYLYDESQQVALAYQNICTPEFFLFDGQRKLAYRGRFDAARPQQPTPVTGADLRAAADAVLQNKPVPAEQQPSMGCSVKWKAGIEPSWA